jgi:hypothetical protein
VHVVGDFSRLHGRDLIESFQADKGVKFLIRMAKMLNVELIVVLKGRFECAPLVMASQLPQKLKFILVDSAVLGTDHS